MKYYGIGKGPGREDDETETGRGGNRSSSSAQIGPSEVRPSGRHFNSAEINQGSFTEETGKREERGKARRRRRLGPEEEGLESDGLTGRKCAAAEAGMLQWDRAERLVGRRRNQLSRRFGIHLSQENAMVWESDLDREDPGSNHRSDTKLGACKATRRLHPVPTPLQPALLPNAEAGHL